MSVPTQIEFNRPTKFQVVKVLGQGACGATVQIRDDDMGCDFVAKKYSPFISADADSSLYEELLDRFRDEARILFQLNHPNVVRVFNFFDYREFKTSYIIMELVSGPDILKYLSRSPANADKVFEGVVDGFAHLQQKNILHRDIRPMNILVDENGAPKIIDFGFGKRLELEQSQAEKSISLNWWCDTPPEFQDGVYDFQTEVYFAGKLFQKAIEDCNLTDFKYMQIIREMAEPNRGSRARSFLDVQRTIVEGKFSDLAFSDSEIMAYREFADAIAYAISKISSDAEIERDTVKIIGRLDALYRRTMLEEYLADSAKLVQIFVSGGFRYYKNSQIYISTIREFLGLLKGLSEEKKSIVVDNLMSRFDAVAREYPSSLDDEIPF